ncbi:GAF domain-containing protein [Spirulina major CS-329]|uniref:GAF domain-containing protein n=1 Tax=Spirulina TaxID=1154 RepID=UPI00232C5F4F|nr:MULTISPECIES: GAF domain-containing protein [Spirulina]MDB9494620.1 GAF domain-containing protein [Spirulina subsalsa CS-330]MDB9505184.1 GAF domain-containing protein [Spirulina major CS-329]
MTATSSNPYSTSANSAAPPNSASSPPSPEQPLREVRQQGVQLRSALRAAKDRESLLAIAVEQIRLQLQASRALIYQFTTPSQGTVIAEHLERGWTPTYSETLPATFFGVDTQGEYDQQEVVSIKYVATTDVTPYQLQLLEKYQVRSSVSVVIRLRGGAWGLLVVQQCNEVRHWSQQDMVLLEQGATVLAAQLIGYEVDEEHQQQLQRDEIVQKVSDRIRRSVDLKTIFQTTTQELRQLLKADRVALYRFNPDWTGKFVAESVGAGWVSLLQTPPDPDLLRDNSENCNLNVMAGGRGGNISIGEVRDTYLERTQGGLYSRGEKLRVVNDVYAKGFPGCYLELLERMQARAYLTVGVYQGGQLWGLLATYQCSGERTWQDWEIRIASQLADQLGVALQQTANLRQRDQQAEQLKQAIERERAIANVNDKIKQSQDPDTIFRTAVNEARRLLQSDRVAIYRFNPDWSGTFIAESVGSEWKALLNAQVADERILEGTDENINSEGCTIKDMKVRQLATLDTYLKDTQGGAYRKGEQFRVSNDVYNSKFPACYLQLLESFQARAYINVPIFLDDKLWGLMPCYQCSGPRDWTDDEIKLMVNLGSQLGIALQRAASLEAVKAQARRLEAAVERERAIANVSEKIKQSQEPETIFRTAVDEARQLLGSDRVAIYKFNTDWTGNFIAESVNPGWKSLLNAQVVDETILAGTDSNINSNGCTIKDMKVRQLATLDTYLKDTQGGAYRKGEQFRASNDIYASKFPDCYIQLLESFQARAYITVPIFLKDKLWGLMPCYQCSGPRDWTDEEITLMVNLGSQLGIALQRAADLEAVKAQAQKLQEALNRERALATVSDKIKDTDDINAIFSIATQEVRALLRSDRVVVYRFNPDWSGVFVAESVEPGWVSLMGKQGEDPELLKATAQNIDTVGCTIKDMRIRRLASEDTYLRDTQGGAYRKGAKFRVSNDIYKSKFPDCYIRLLETFQAKAYVTVPIFLKDKLWGLMACYQCAAPRTWEDEEIKLMVSAGSQLGIALQRAADLDAVKQQTQKLEKAIERERAIALISDKIRQSQDVSTIFKSTTREARQLFESDRVGIYRFNPDWTGEFVAESVGNNWLSLLSYQVEDPSLLEKTKVNIDTEGCTIKQMQVRQMASKDTYLQRTEGGAYRQGAASRVCNDIYAAGFPDCYVELLEAFQARAYITVPIFLGDRLWGLMANYQCSGPRQWENAEIQLMVQLGSQLGIALQRAADLTQLRQQAQELETAAAREKLERQELQQRALNLLRAVRPALEGDLTVRAPLSEDELGTIADVYNNTLQSLRGIVIQVQDVTARVAETSKGSDVQIRQLAAQAQRQAQELNQALAEVQKMVNFSQDVGVNAAAIEQAVQNANQTVHSGDSAMNRTVEGILAIRDTVSEASQKIRELSESSQKIDRVVNLISDFATQTQLLSLNAAIEATRAGEYGKGFAVVADEVRSLACQSASATLEISNLVAEIRQQTSEVIKVTEAAITQVSAGTSLVEETKGNLTAIAAATAQISELVESITTATTAQLEQSKSVTQTMREVAEISDSTSAESVQLSNTFQDTLTTAQTLQEVVKQFKVN